MASVVGRRTVGSRKGAAVEGCFDRTLRRPRATIRKGEKGNKESERVSRELAGLENNKVIRNPI